MSEENAWDELAIFRVRWCVVCMESTPWVRGEDGVLRCAHPEHEAWLKLAFEKTEKES